ncbi:16020_t:CDS:10 [Entrophospora sp. SA101]|nr:16020_t:CDS:10 [Entrophospora sp. SA101]CAJ0827590.1 7287_t:CDS:10 [Entrophospora sp. SA101]
MTQRPFFHFSNIISRQNRCSISFKSNLKSHSRCYHTSSVLTPVEPKTYGQPTHETHPHIMKSGEVTPGISAAEYELRRALLIEKLPENRFNEPDSAIVLGYKMTMFVPPKNKSIEMWDGPRTGLAVKPLSRLIQDLRLVKSDSEIKLMKKAGLSEHDLYAKIDFECRIRGAQFLAYVPVVACGINALTMHYVRNDMPLRDGELVLMDAGGEYYGYASDITRTWPVNGRFTQPQKELYEAVLKLCTEEQNISLNGIHEYSVKMMKEELSPLGFDLVEGDVDRVLYPHHVGHYLGLDVHDTHDIDRSKILRKGMPGIYVPRNKAYPEQYHGMGIRIEDNVLVGESDPIVLSSSAPKEINLED